VGGKFLISHTSGRRWKYIREVRECIFGRVFHAVEMVHEGGVVQHGQEVAVKVRSSKAKIRERRHAEDPVVEIATLQYLSSNGSHPNVLQVVEVVEDAATIFLITPFCKGGELFDIICSCGRLEEAEARMYFLQLMHGLAHLDSLGICHRRDLSLENVLLLDEDQSQAVIMDFGMALRMPGGGGVRCAPQGAVGKPNYRTPEIYRNRPFHSGPVDIWACGVSLLIMLTGEDPPLHPPVTGIVHNVSGTVEQRLDSFLLRAGAHLSRSAIDLLRSMLRESPSQRLTLAEIGNHPWMLAVAD
ncbi:unnamed protein product, partial [Phaeothamnion confervicola]